MPDFGLARVFALRHFSIVRFPVVGTRAPSEAIGSRRRAR